MKSLEAFSKELSSHTASFAYQNDYEEYAENLGKVLSHGSTVTVQDNEEEIKKCVSNLDYEPKTFVDSDQEEEDCNMPGNETPAEF